MTARFGWVVLRLADQCLLARGQQSEDEKYLDKLLMERKVF